MIGPPGWTDDSYDLCFRRETDSFSPPLQDVFYLRDARFMARHDLPPRRIARPLFARPNYAFSSSSAAAAVDWTFLLSQDFVLEQKSDRLFIKSNKLVTILFYGDA